MNDEGRIMRMVQCAMGRRRERAMGRGKRDMIYGYGGIVCVV